MGDRLHIIGTVHVDPASASAVREAILRLRPEVVALELDEARLYSLQNPGMAKMSGSAGPSFLAMILLERFAGEVTGSPPGAEMLEAVRAAQSVGARIELIDMPVYSTIAGLRRIPFKEKLRLAIDSVASLMLLPFGRTELSKLTERIEDQLAAFRNRYPSLSRLLLDVREEYMTNRLKRILDSTMGQTVAVVGLGHSTSLRKRLEQYERGRIFSAGYSWSITTGAS